ncbi:MAG: hypothetical protein L0Y66_26765 [Myxococcaceae bacterium]|nr:hypothetical protein [Myxococcaceae bacterium]
MSLGRDFKSAQEMVEKGEPNYLLSAFKSQYNLIGLGTAVGFAILSGSFLPLLLAAGFELTMLPLAERWARYRRARGLEDEKKKRKHMARQQMLEELGEDERRRYFVLEALASEIRQNYTAHDPSSRVLLEELAGKLDFLLAFYLRMRHSVVRYDRYFATANASRMQQRLGALEKEIAAAPPRLQEVKSRTKAVLEKRIERYQRALENKQLVDAQTETVQEVLQLLRDQSYSMRDPRSIAEQLDSLVSAAEQTERGVKDMEEILAIEDEALVGPLGAFEDDDLELEPPPAPREVAARPPVVPPPLPNPASGTPVAQKNKVRH